MADETITASAETIASNDDLLEEILIRLPIKSLIKLKSVSKHWLSLISTVRFCSRRTSHPNSASGLILFCKSSRTKPRLDFIDFNGVNNTFALLPGHAGRLESLPFLGNTISDLLHSCNGLLLFRTPSLNFSIKRKRSRERKFYVANPTTKQYTLLPKPSSCDNYSDASSFSFNLVYDPSKSLNSFKVVCIRKSGCIEKPYQIEIYSSETAQWKLSGGFFDAPLYLNLDYLGGGDDLGGVFWNGAVHWIRICFPLLMYFNVEQEVVKHLLLPVGVINDAPNYFINSYFGESRGHLHFIEMFWINTYSAQMIPEFDIYELERDYSKWTLLFHVDLSQSVFSFLQERRRTFKVLYVSRSEKEEESYTVLRLPDGLLFVYYYMTQTLKQIISHPSTTSVNLELCCVHPYTESLAVLDLN